MRKGGKKERGTKERWRERKQEEKGGRDEEREGGRGREGPSYRQRRGGGRDKVGERVSGELGQRSRSGELGGERGYRHGEDRKAT